MRYFFTVVALWSICGLSWAHEGHDHDAPAAVQAPKGGLIKSLESVHVEVVAKGKDIKVYLYSLDLKPQDASEMKVVLKAQLPRTKKEENLQGTVRGNMIQASFDAKGSHRYILLVTVSGGGQDHEDTLKFNIEPRR